MTPEKRAIAKRAFLAKVTRYGGRTINGDTVLIVGEDSIGEAIDAAIDAAHERERHELFPDFACEFDEDDYTIHLPSGHGVTVFKDGKIIITVPDTKVEKPVATSVAQILDPELAHAAREAERLRDWMLKHKDRSE